jgi:protein-tyrosine phosphatase
MVRVTFAVLFVCTGNVCRSPMAELLFRAWSDPSADVVVGSAGMQALVGHGIDHASASALGQLGIDPTRHRAKQFQPWMSRDADLILTANRAHRDLAIRDMPSAYKRTFTMKEFARLVADVAPGAPVDVVAGAAARRRALGPQEHPEVDDIRDPFRAAVRHAKTIAEEITEVVYPTVSALGFAAQVPNTRPMVRSRGSNARPAPY